MEKVPAAMEWGKVAVAALVCVLAIAASLASQMQSEDPLGEIGEFFFGLLGSDEVCYALPVAYFRMVMAARADEPIVLRAIHSVLLGAVAWWENAERYEALAGTFVASYVFASDVAQNWVGALGWACASGAVAATLVHKGLIVTAMSLAAGIVAAYGSCRLMEWLGGEHALVRAAPPRSPKRLVVHTVAFVSGAVLLPTVVYEVACFLMPIQEMRGAYDMMASFVGKEALNTMTTRLLVVTTLCQVSLGYLGIAFIRRGQNRKNALLAVGDGKMSSRGFSRLVGTYMLTVAVPYMLQRTIMENVNTYVHGEYQQALERSLRISALFPCQRDGTCDTTLAAAQGSKFTVEGYADGFNSIGQQWYRMIEDKLFALPKILLLPGMLVGQPRLVLTVLPASLLLDVGRASMLTALNKRIEKMNQKVQELANKRRKMEGHDTKNEELIRRGASAEFVESQWGALAKEMQLTTVKYTAVSQLRNFINFLYYQDILGPGIELVLAALLESGDILGDDIWVYTRVVEETMNFLLTRFRMDDKLALLKTHMDRVDDLKVRLQSISDSERPTCQLQPSLGTVRVEGLRYTRGPSHSVEIDRLDLHPGRVYAVTGANGCGKSSFFGLLASCGARATKMPEGLKIGKLDSLVIPTEDIVEITQKLYCPLSTPPLAWLLRRRLEEMQPDDVQRAEARASELLRSLEFHSGEGRAGVETAELDLLSVADDWYGTLSGGQKIKVEMVQKLFLQEECPRLILIDEAFAPLDPKSKAAVQKKLKELCSRSLILAIYHTDASDGCITGDFFDDVLHFENGTASIATRCT